MRAPLVISSLVVVALAGAPAKPCSPAMPGLGGGSAPAREAADVPTNAILQVPATFPPFTFTATIRKDVDGAEPLNLDTSFDGSLAIVGLGLLEADTDYVIELDDDATNGFDDDFPEPIRFHTGAGDDVTRPSLDGEPEVTVDHQNAELFATTSCGPIQETNFVRVRPPSADDDVGVASFRLFRVLDNGARELRAAVLASELQAGFDEIVDRQDDAGTYTYELVAVDLAGNESDPVRFDVGVSGFGCSASPATSSPASFALLGLVLAGLYTNRRQRRPSVVE